jgi:hypothetical protein
MKEIKERALGLALAVYRVTNLFPGGEVLIGQIRKTANQLLSESILDNKKESLKQIEIILNYFRIAKAQNWIKSINFVILTREYQQLAEEIKSLESEKLVVIKPSEKVNSLNKRQEKILSYVKDKDFVQLKELSVLFPKMSLRTIRKDLNEMAQRKILFQQGRGRSSFYGENKAYNRV